MLRGGALSKVNPLMPCYEKVLTRFSQVGAPKLVKNGVRSHLFASAVISLSAQNRPAAIMLRGGVLSKINPLMPCYEKVLTRFSQVGAPKRKLFGLSV